MTIIKNKQLAKLLAASISNNKEAILSQWYINQFIDKSLDKWKISGIKSINRDQAIDSYLKPLINLLIGYLNTEQIAFLYGYLDERLRYAPHRESPEVRASFFSEILNKDEKSILSNLNLSQDQKYEIVELLQTLHSPLIEKNHGNQISILALGDCLMNEIRVFLPHMCKNNKISLDMRCIYFSAKMDQGIDLTEIADFIRNNKVDIIALSFFSYEALPLYTMLLKESGRLSQQEIDNRIDMIMNMLEDMLNQIRKHTEATLLIHNISGLPLGRYRKRIPLFPIFSSKKKHLLINLNSRIKQLVSNINNAELVDESSIASENGYRNCAQAVYPKHVVANGMLHTGKLGYYLSEAYHEKVSAYATLHKCKAIMVDFDNTLWSGVMADGDVIHFRDKQKLLKDLKDTGILLISVSKNTEKNIRWDEMVLKYEDFVLHKINWDLKVNSISNAVKELNIGMDSIAFIDDNPVELELVKQQLQDITVLNATDDKTWTYLKMMFSFPGTKETEESLKRTEMYRQSFERKSSLEQRSHDYPTMMASLNLNVSFRKSCSSDISRIYELVNRTNQFNTTTIRYSKKELKEMMQDNSKWKIFVATLEDKFGSLGIVLVVILELEENFATINSFIMSCRAMGFALENQILHLLSDTTIHNRQRLVGIYKETDRNTPCANLYNSCNFTEESDGKWVYQIGSNEEIKAVSWINMIDE